MKGFDFSGGGRVSLQFAVVATTLSIYHGAQIAEVVRGGLLAVPSGQFEASQALGLKSWQTIRLVILPQVMRIVIPPMNNQYVKPDQEHVHSHRRGLFRPYVSVGHNHQPELQTA